MEFKSSSINPALIQLLNLIGAGLVTKPSGSVPASLTLGAAKFEEIDCTDFSVAISMNSKLNTSAQVTISFPGSDLEASGYINNATLEKILNAVPTYTSSTLPAASSVPVGSVAFNTTTNRLLVSNGTSWVGQLNIEQNENASQLGPAGTVSFNSPNISKTATGVISINASMTVEEVTQSTATFSLYRDGLGGTLISQQMITPGGTGGTPEVFGDLTWFDTLPDSNPHYYTIACTATGNLTVPIGNADFQLQEL